MLGKWIKRKRFENQRKELRRLQLEEVQKYMKKVYNPLYYGVKPKFRGKKQKDDILSVNLGVRSIYNPPVKRHYDEMIDIDRRVKT